MAEEKKPGEPEEDAKALARAIRVPRKGKGPEEAATKAETKR